MHSLQKFSEKKGHGSAGNDLKDIREIGRRRLHLNRTPLRQNFFDTGITQQYNRAAKHKKEVIETEFDLVDEILANLRDAVEQAQQKARVSPKAKKIILATLIEDLYTNPAYARSACSIWHGVDDRVAH